MWFKRKVILSDDFVELSIGRVYYKPLLNRHVREAENLSQGNWNVYYTLIELRTLNLKEREYEQLSVIDGQKVRDKTKTILKRYGIEEPAPKTIDDEWSASDKKWFREQQAAAENRMAQAMRKT